MSQTASKAKGQKARVPRRPRVNTSSSLLTIQEVSGELLLSERIIYRLIEIGELKGFWPSPGRVYVHVDDFSAFMTAKLGRPAVYAKTNGTFRQVPQEVKA
jgi:hypothetical protein